MASKTYDAGYGNKIHGLVGTFCESTSVDAVAQAMNQILRCVDGQPISNYIPLGQQKNTLVSSAKAHVYAGRWNRKGIHPVLFGRVLDAAKRGKRAFFSAYVIQAFCKIVRRVVRAKLRDRAKSTGVMMAIDQRRQGKSGRYIDADGSEYFFGVDENQAWWQVLTQKEWKKHTRSGPKSNLIGASALVLRGKWSDLSQPGILRGDIRPVQGPVQLGSMGLAYWQIQKVVQGINLTNPNCIDSTKVGDVSGHIDPETGIWMSFDNTKGLPVRLTGLTHEI
eukprot:g1430.t1